MDDPLLHFKQVMLVSGLTSICLVGILLLLTVWRKAWRRLVEAEGSFWKRLGFGGKWTAGLRRLEESRFLLYAVGVVLVMHLSLFVWAVSAYRYYGPRLKNRQRTVQMQVVPAKRPPVTMTNLKER